MYSRSELTLHSALSLLALVLGGCWNAILRWLPRGAHATEMRGPVYDLTNHIAVITGSNTGIGKETALSLAKYGGTVILACRDSSKGIAAANDINRQLATIVGSDSEYIFPHSAHGRALYMKLDLTDELSILEFSRKLKDTFPRIDILINNAGLNSKGVLRNGLQQLFQVNYLGHYLLLRCLESHIAGQGDATPSHASTTPRIARVINLSSVMHHVGQADYVASAFTKYTSAMKQQCSYYADSKLYMHYLTMEVNRRWDCRKPYHFSCYDIPVHSAEEVACSKDQLRRPVVGISVNPGAVRSDIWRNYPLKWLMDYAMRALFLDVQQGASTSVYAAVLDIELLRSYQVGISAPTFPASHSQRVTYQVHDGGGRMCLRADCPYVVPYYTAYGLLALELFGAYAGPRFSPITLPTVGLGLMTDLTPADSHDTVGDSRRALQPLTPSIQAAGLWDFSADLCKKLLLQGGCTPEDVEFLSVN